MADPFITTPPGFKILNLMIRIRLHLAHALKSLQKNYVIVIFFKISDLNIIMNFFFF